MTWRRCPVVVCLAGLFLFGVLQLVPLPHGVLSRLSPATVRLCDKLLPAQRETLPEGDIPLAPLAAKDRLSLYPGGTRAELVRLLGVFLLFVAVRHNAASPKALGHLAVAATVNGAALALFAFLQFFSSSHQTIYWGLPVPQGSPFGPFICRNHFPFYVNMCIGLAAGLLLAQAAQFGPFGGLKGTRVQLGRILETHSPCCTIRQVCGSLRPSLSCWPG